MQIERRDGARERRILTSLVVDKAVLGKLAPKWEREGLFSSPWANLIATWCFDYFDKYGKAPKQAIEGLFEAWADKGKDKDTVKLVERFLSQLSGEYEEQAKESNSEYITDLAGKHFNEVKLRSLADAIKGDIDSSDLDGALKRIHGYGRLEVGSGSGVDVFHDKAAFKRAFEAKKDPLITYPGAVGTFLGDALERDGFVVFEGPEKSGKSWCLQHLAFTSAEQKRRTLFLAIGDMSEEQMMIRFSCYLAGRPLKPSKVKVPIFIEHDQDNPFSTVDFEERDFPTPLDWKAAYKAARSRRDQQSYLKLFAYPNSSINVLGIKALLQTLERQNWVADVIVLDYADLLASMPGLPAGGREQIDADWRALRSISQYYHNLVVTATQSDADSYDTLTMTKRNFSGDKRKNAHVTAMIGINATEAEQELGLVRWNFVVRRNAKALATQCVHIAGCLDLANPVMLSTF